MADGKLRCGRTGSHSHFYISSCMDDGIEEKKLEANNYKRMVRCFKEGEGAGKKESSHGVQKQIREGVRRYNQSGLVFN